MVENRRETYLIGPLWGLMDLGDARLGDALADLLIAGHTFAELLGFLHKRGTVRAVLPLMQMLLQQPKRDRYEPLLALGVSAGSRFLTEDGTQGAFSEPAFRRAFDFYAGLFRDGLASLLTAWDMEIVGQASDGQEGVEKARALRPDLILMDVNMPKLSGHDVLASRWSTTCSPARRASSASYTLVRTRPFLS